MPDNQYPRAATVSPLPVKASGPHVLVIGSGSIGRRHAKNLADLGAKVSLFDINRTLLMNVCTENNYTPVKDLEQALAKEHYCAALICSPTSLHLEHALRAAAAGCHLFIEKPISDTLDGLPRLLDLIQEKNLVTLVGCNFRFHPGLMKIHLLLHKGAIGRIISSRAQFGQYLPDWHPWEDYRHTYSAQKKLGGGVILDRIHEIDYMRWLFGEVSEVTAMAGHFSHLEIDTEDIAEILIKFTNSTIGSIHLDYIRRTYDASLEIVGENGTIRWNYQNHFIEWYVAEENRWQSIKWEKLDRNQMYIDEMKHFLKVINNQEESICPAREATKVLEIALAVKEAAKDRKVIQL